MKPLLALLAFLLLAGAAPRVEVGPLLRCGGGRACAAVELSMLPLSEPETVLVRRVHVPPGALPLNRPLMVRIIAMASSEVRWNGVTIGSNGVPAPDSARERPGRFVAGFIVPSALVRPGANSLEVRLSAHHLWLPVRRPVHLVEVVPYIGEDLPGLVDYLPALLALGALAGAFIYFAAAWRSEEDRGALLLALAAAAAIAQLLAEVSRAFIAYPYPWHLARVAVVALLAAVVSLLLTAYCARRFAPEWRSAVPAVTAAAAAASLLLIPWYDIKAMGAIVAGAAASALCAGRGLRRRSPRAAVALAASVAAPALLGWQFTAFLDQGWYVLLAVLFILLVAEQVASLRRARAERDSEARRSARLAERLSRAEREGETIVVLKEGSRSYRLAESDIVAIRAADDYCEALLGDGRNLLVTMSLARLLATLPPRFVRVHKSYAVNRSHVASVAPRPGGGRELRLSNGSTVPVGRSYGAVVAQAIC